MVCRCLHVSPYVSLSFLIFFGTHVNDDEGCANWPVEECLEHPWLVERCERRRIRRLRAEGRTSLGGASLLLGN